MPIWREALFSDRLIYALESARLELALSCNLDKHHPNMLQISKIIPRRLRKK